MVPGDGEAAVGKPAPTIEYINPLLAENEMATSAERQDWDTIAEVRAGKHVLNVPPPWNRLVRPIHVKAVADTIRRVVASLTLTMPSVAVPAAGLSYKYQENATLREKWSTALLAEMDSAHLPDRPFRQGMDHAVSFGEGIWKLVYTPHTWFDYPTSRSMFDKGITELSKSEERKLNQNRDTYKRGRVPFAWRAVDPRTY